MDINEMRENLNVTWSDPETDEKIERIYNRAEVTINDYAGCTVDYSSDLIAAQLLHDCARYIWNECLDEFERRYQPQIVALRNNALVAAYKKESEETAASEG